MATRRVYKSHVCNQDIPRGALLDVRIDIRLLQSNSRILRTTSTQACVLGCIREETRTHRPFCIIHEANACRQSQDAPFRVDVWVAALEVESLEVKDWCVVAGNVKDPADSQQPSTIVDIFDRLIVGSENGQRTGTKVEQTCLCLV